ncbi:MAG: exodeoxyribonuclease VII small subunit [Pseudomonadales bacterium]
MPAKKKTVPEPAAEPALDLDFEAALAELDTLVQEMETGELGLDASLAAFERGIALTRHCQQALKQAELKVQALTKDGDLEDLDLDELDDH